MCRYKQLPSTLKDEPYDLWFPEERRFLFFLDACWGSRTKDVQITEVIISEIYDILDAPDDAYMPRGVAINMRKALDTAPEEDRESIRRQLLEMPHHRKKAKIMELFDALKNLVDSERLVEVAKTLNESMRNKLVVGGGVAAEKTTKETPHVR